MLAGVVIPADLVRVMDQVESSLEEKWSLDRFAGLAGLSPAYFHRRFRDVMDETPVAFVERLRLERAALLLLASERSITDLALEVGFHNPETFARRFRARFGVAARDYRRHQLENWSRLGLVAGCDPLEGSGGRIEVRTLEPVRVESRRRVGDEEPFDFSPAAAPWDEGDAPSDVTRYGLTLDWPGITEPGRVRQEWARSHRAGPPTPGWVARELPGGLCATLVHEGAEPVPNEIYQRLYVWALGGTGRLRPGPIVEIGTPAAVTVCQPIQQNFQG